MDWVKRRFRGHVTIGPLVIFGFNAMHVALNWHTKRWGWVCFHPPIKHYDHWWPWYFYVSPNATPSCATFGMGPGFREEGETKGAARLRRRKWGHNFNSDLYYNELRSYSVEHREAA